MRSVFACTFVVVVSLMTVTAAHACSGMKSASKGDVFTTVSTDGQSSPSILLPQTPKPSSDNG